VVWVGRGKDQACGGRSGGRVGGWARFSSNLTTCPAEDTTGRGPQFFWIRDQIIQTSDIQSVVKAKVIDAITLGLRSEPTPTHPGSGFRRESLDI